MLTDSDQQRECENAWLPVILYCFKNAFGLADQVTGGHRMNQVLFALCVAIATAAWAASSSPTCVEGAATAQVLTISCAA